MGTVAVLPSSNRVVGRATPMSSPMLDFALHYHTCGFSLIPIKAGTKNEPLGKWKRFQTEPADELQLRK